MGNYIDKDALVTEIERLKANALQKKCKCKRSGLERIMHQIGAYNKILSFLNTLKVKEVDLEKEMDKYFDEHDEEFARDEYLDYAKYFFEFGLKAQKGE